MSIGNIKHLVSRSEAEMLKYRNFGRKSLNELGEILDSLNLDWGMDLSPYAGIEMDEETSKTLAEEF